MKRGQSSNSNLQSQNLQKKPIVVSTFTRKGGVGKTTASYEIAAWLAKKSEKLRVLLVDADSQCNLSQNVIKATIEQKYHYLDESTRAELLRALTRKFLVDKKNTPKINETAVNLQSYKIEIKNVDRNDIGDEESVDQFLDEQLLEFHAENSDGKRFLFYKFRDRWFIAGTKVNGNVFANVEIDDRETINILSDNNQRGAEVTEEQEKRLIYMALKTAGYSDYFNDEIKKFIKSNLIVVDSIDLLENITGDDNDFILTKDADGSWLLYKRKDLNNPLDLEDFEELKNYLNSLHANQATDLSEDKRDTILTRLKNIQPVNLLHSVEPWIGKTIRGESIRTEAENISLISLKVQIDSGSTRELSRDDDKKGELFLLPGHYNLQLRLGRMFSLAVEGLVEKSERFQMLKDRFYGLNELIRHVAEINSIDIVIIDLSPSADDLNSAFLMISDFFFSTYTPEPYNDHAILSITETIRQWAKDYQPLYTNKSNNTGCRKILSPPKALGFMFQKVKKKGREYADRNSKEIAEGVVELFNNSLIPVLKRAGMYPEYGVYGITEDHALRIGDVVTAPYFDSKESEKSRSGYPVVWSPKFLGPHHAFTRVVCQVIGHAFVCDLEIPEPLKEIFREFVVEQKKVEEGFGVKWSTQYSDYRKSLSYRERIKSIKKAHYRIDYLDMLIFVRNIRGRYLGEPSDDMYKPNRFNAYILDPFLFKDLNSNLSKAFSDIYERLYEEQNEKQNKKLNRNITGDIFYMIIPIFYGIQWYCIRVQIDFRKETLNLLFDDPRGLSNAKDRKNKSKKPELKYAGEEKKFVYTAIQLAILAAKKNFARFIVNRQWDFQTTELLFKRLDQQGWPMNDTDSGVIIIANIEDYVKEKSNGKLYSNRKFDKTVNIIIVKNAIEEVMDEFDMSLEQKAVFRSSVQSSPIHYTIKAFKKPEPISSVSVKEYRSNLSLILDELESDFKKASTDQACVLHNNRVVKEYQKYIKMSLLRILPEFIPELSKLFSNSQPWMISYVISLAYFKAYYGHNSRKTLLREEDAFRKEIIKEILSVLNKKDNKSQTDVPQIISLSNATPFDPEFLTLFEDLDRDYYNNFYGLELYPQLPTIVTDSFFEAVALVAQNAGNAHKIRGQVAQKLTSDSSITSEFHRQNPHIILADYAAEMASPEKAPTAFEVNVLAQSVLNRPIVVLGCNANEHRIFGIHKEILEGNFSDPIFLHRQSKDYYIPLWVPSGQNSRHIFNEILKAIPNLNGVGFTFFPDHYQSNRSYYGLEPCARLNKVGNCLFEAVARSQRTSERAIDKRSSELRTLAVEYIQSNEVLKERISAGVNKECLKLASGREAFYESVEDYLEKMSGKDRNGVDTQAAWGTQIEVYALSHVLRVPIAIVTFNNTYDHIYGEEYERSKTIFLSYTGNHYEALMPNENASNPDERVRLILQAREQIDQAIQSRRTQFSHSSPSVGEKRTGEQEDTVLTPRTGKRRRQEGIFSPVTQQPSSSANDGGYSSENLFGDSSSSEQCSY